MTNTRLEYPDRTVITPLELLHSHGTILPRVVMVAAVLRIGVLYNDVKGYGR